MSYYLYVKITIVNYCDKLYKMRDDEHIQTVQDCKIFRFGHTEKRLFTRILFYTLSETVWAIKTSKNMWEKHELL
jgi:hypothetical protein